MKNDPNKGWRDGKIEQFEPRTPPILKTDGKPCIPVSQFWSHNQESGKSSPAPVVSHFQACSMGELHPKEPIGHASIFFLATSVKDVWDIKTFFYIVAGVTIISLFSIPIFVLKNKRKNRKISESDPAHQENWGI